MFTVYTDGACSGNTNKDKSKTKAGYGVYFETPITVGGKKISKISGPVDSAKHMPSNSSGEIMGVLRALDMFRKHVEERDEDEELPTLVLYCDNQYCVNTFNTWLAGWKAKNETKAQMALWNMVWDHIQYLQKRYGKDYKNKVQVKWVRGHNGTEGNEIADKLATSGVHLEKEKRIILKKKADTLTTKQET
ncbi:Ribonuclease HI [Kaumoebavirus]|uniref:Rnase H n=1 Tax=Kaumoebavirus TaxID=1859492 RepID=UPI0009C373CA|nr:Rnase H [Kaumoebavirus]ARA72207.1 Ribonuclease HI [Kaumoebavirus]